MAERSASPFLDARADQIIYADDLSLGLWDRFPVSPGHALVVTRRVIAEWFDATQEEQAALLAGIDKVRGAILRIHEPDGFNIGVNVGSAAGQTVPHLHVHLIPRYRGDVPDPTGGVRGVIAGAANYLRMPTDALGNDETAAEHLIRGGDEHQLLPHLKEHYERSFRVDIAVAFVMRRGAELLFDVCRDLIDRQFKSTDAPVIRVVTGDYLGATNPDALRRLLDLGDGLDLRVFEAKARSYHPKAYIFHYKNGGGVAFVGSSNLSGPALESGVEWNYRIVSSSEASGFADVTQAFEELLRQPEVRTVDEPWIQHYEASRGVPQKPSPEAAERPPEEPPPVIPEPHEIQREALDALRRTRDEGNCAGLVVLATGLGKTWLAAFDSVRFRRVLFVAHREEILSQALDTFRRIRPHVALGKYTGAAKDRDADVVFASVQTLGRERHLSRFDPAEFDYIVVDEFHHAHAKTYRALINHFAPKFLLGLTATPERTDGGDILSLCEENLVYRCDLMEGIQRERLCAFRYYGVPDGIDYTNIPWRNGRFDPDAVTSAYAVQARAENALEQLRERGGNRTICFCCSVKHADYMRGFFSENGVRTAAVHSETTSDPRTSSLEKLEEGELDVVCAVDILNEGVDLPHVDTVLMLRPTESAILWLQQFGRGLRRAVGKDYLSVIDYIGNHRAFLVKPMALLGATNDAELSSSLKLIEDGDLELPPGCSVTYELEAMSILQQLLQARLSRTDRAQAWYEDFKERTGERPRAVEALHEGISLAGIRASYKSWLHFVAAQGDLDQSDSSLLTGTSGEFLSELEVTRMTKSYKMVLLKGMLDQGFPGQIGIDDLGSWFERFANRSSILKAELGEQLKDTRRLQKYIEDNPIHAWTSRASTSGQPFFEYKNDEFATAFDVPGAQSAAFSELVDELVEYRLADYWRRYREREGVGGTFVLRVIRNSSDKPILILPDRERHPGLPTGATPLEIDGETYEATVAKIAINVVRNEGEAANVLPELMHRWFGADAGLRGLVQQVYLQRHEGGWSLTRELGGTSDEPALYSQHLTREIKELFRSHRRKGNWMSGYVRLDTDSVLLVTLQKGRVQEHLNYQDRFLAVDEFQWESPASTTQASEAGQEIVHHVRDGRAMHLFVRVRKKDTNGQTVPYTYCGRLTLQGYEGEEPIRCRFRLENPLTPNWAKRFGITKSR